MDFETKNIFDFDGKYKLAKYPPKEDGFYMTIRCGLGGIYTNLDEWKNNMWQVGIADASIVIAYSRELIPEEEVNEWCRNKLENTETNKVYDRQKNCAYYQDGYCMKGLAGTNSSKSEHEWDPGPCWDDGNF